MYTYIYIYTYTYTYICLSHCILAQALMHMHMHIHMHMHMHNNNNKTRRVRGHCYIECGCDMLDCLGLLLLHVLNVCIATTLERATQWTVNVIQNYRKYAVESQCCYSIQYHAYNLPTYMTPPYVFP
jgi:hypothetical protein